MPVKTGGGGQGTREEGEEGGGEGGRGGPSVCDLSDVSRFQSAIILIASQILMAIAVVAATCAPAPEPAAGPLPPLLVHYPVIYTAPYAKVYPYHPYPLYYNSYKWIHPGSAYTY